MWLLWVRYLGLKFGGVLVNEIKKMCRTGSSGLWAQVQSGKLCSQLKGKLKQGGKASTLFESIQNASFSNGTEVFHLN